MMRNITDGTISLLHNYYNEEHLLNVIEDVKRLGPPTIRVFDCWFDGIYQALEGCPRLRACEKLGVTPIIIIVDGNETVMSLDLDYDDGQDGETKVCEIGDWENYSIRIENNEITADWKSARRHQINKIADKSPPGG